MALRILLLLAVLVATMPAAGAEPLAVVVPAESRHRLEQGQQLAEIYLKKRQFWPDGQRIVPINLPVADPRRQRFSQLVLGLLPEQLDDYWNERYFHGVLPPEVLNSVEGILRFVASTPGAIGYVPSCSVDSRVATVLLLDLGEGKAAACSPQIQGR